MRRVLALTLISLALAGPQVAGAQPVFVFEGSGWGHGVGMAQYGASGFAAQGWTYDQILAHYYPGTVLGPAPAKKLRVLLASGRGDLEVGSQAAFTVRDANGRYTLSAGTHRLGLDLTLTVDGEVRTLTEPVRFVPGRRPLELDRAYRGALVVSIQGGKLAIVNDVKLEPYVKGVVAREMPPDWPAEALKVQAVAARSYALASRRTSSYFDVYADTRSQVYGGIGAEDRRTNLAVSATKGTVVLYEGKVAWTFFSASSGGKTAAIEDAFGGEPSPYLISVEDPFDEGSPYHRWGPLTFTADELAAKLGSPVTGKIVALEEVRNPSDRVSRVKITTTNGVVELTGSEMRSRLGLRSTWFSIARSDELTSSASRLVFGQEVTLRGLAPGVPQVVLERRPGGGKWRMLDKVTVRATGAFELSLRPETTASYRARVEGSVGTPLRIVVAPEVTVQRRKRANILLGLTRPKLPGASIVIERLRASGWVIAGEAVVRSDGSFVAPHRLAPGTYRARVLATPGLAAGVSPRLTIPSR